MKTCKKCCLDKPYTEYRKDSRRSDGLAHWCKPCLREYERSSSQRYRDNNPGKRSDTQRRYARANKDAVTAKNERWNLANRERRLEIKRNSENKRRAVVYGTTTVKFTQDALSSRADYYGRKCYLCGGPFEQWDHVKPIAKGGAHMLSNLRPACADCNRKKNATWSAQHPKKVLTTEAIGV